MGRIIFHRHAMLVDFGYIFITPEKAEYCPAIREKTPRRIAGL